jgi:hypothetical protein
LIEKDVRGWIITNLGTRAGGQQREHAESGKSYVAWDKKILNNKFLKESLAENHTITGSTIEQDNEDLSFRKKFPADFMTLDGHWVRSGSEARIDDYLYTNQIIHAYERKVPVEDDELYCDFYIPAGKKIYIEFWGIEGDEQYDKRKKMKLEIYKKNQLNLIELTRKDLEHLDDVLSRKLLKYEIKGYL